ncbi:unnamed protein product [Callosobruchus maculatus]|uniref:E3 ubiquitin-protein ligase RBBP6 n=1 Tax=Callosobruchus maculatus TaxID=64391 RepID=A0A653C8S0_CALMS|nr:unnamed protein product [Callosobruchus maculatus]
MSVHYKFKSALEYDTVTFDGLHISVKDLKNAIIQQKRIGKSTDFDLQVTNAQTKEVYVDDNVLIPKNTSLLIARIPVTAQKQKQWEGYGGDNTPPTKLDEGGPITKATDLSSLDAPEDDKIKAMMSQSTQDYDPSNYQKIRGANQMGPVPPNYKCYKCHQGGHWIKDCTFSLGSDPIEIKKSTGIPKSFMVPVDGPQVPGAMMTPNGQYAVPLLDHQAYNQMVPPAPAAEPKPEIPEDLICSICNDLLTDAVMIPCCGNSFCDECIRFVLLDSEDHECPDCHEKDISPDTLIPNRFIRTSVGKFKNTTGYVKKPIDRPARYTAVMYQKSPPQVPESTERLPAEHRTVISEADSTEHSRNTQEADNGETGKFGSEEGPPGVSPRSSPKERIRRLSPSREHRERSSKHKYRDKDRDDSPRRSSRSNRSPSHKEPREGRSLTPTVDEPSRSHFGGSADYNSSAPPPGTIPPVMGVAPPMQGPPPQTIPTTYSGPGQPPMGSFPPTQGPPPPNFRPFPMQPRPMFDASRPPMGGPPPFNPSFPQGSRREYGRRRDRTPPGVIDDPLAAFNRMLREKDEQKRRQIRRMRRSFSRSRSRSGSRTPPPIRRRQRSRSPMGNRPRRGSRSRSRSRSFSLSRSRSRSFSGSRRGSPPPPYRSPLRRGSPPPASRKVPRYRSPSPVSGGRRSRSPPPRSRSRSFSGSRRGSPPPPYRSPLRRGSPPPASRKAPRYRSPSPVAGGRRSRSPPPRSRYVGGRERSFEEDRDFGGRPPRGGPQRDRRSRDRDRDRYFDGGRGGPPPGQQWPQDYYGGPQQNPQQVGGVPPPGYQPNRYGQVPHGRDFPPTSYNQPYPQGMPNIQQSQRQYQDIRPPGVDDELAPPGVDDPPPRLGTPRRDEKEDRNPERKDRDKDRDRDRDRKRRRDKRSRTPDRPRNPSPRRKSKSRDRETPERRERRKRRDSSEDRKSDDEKKRSKDKKKHHKEKKDTEKRKKKEKKEKHKKDKESKEKKSKEEKKVSKKEEETKEETTQVVVKQEPKSEDRELEPVIKEEPMPSEEPPEKELGAIEDEQQPIVKQEPEFKQDLYDEMADQVDVKIVEGYGKLEEDSSFEERVDNETMGLEEPMEEGEIKEIEDEEKDVLELHTTDMDLKTEMDKNDILAPVPEISKWEVDDEGMMSPKDSCKSDTKSDKSGKVTNEVLKRAENAIFAKAINAIRPIEIKKIGADRIKLYSGEAEKQEVVVVSSTVEVKKDQPPARLPVKERLGVKVDDPDKVINLTGRNRSGTVSPFSRRGESGRNYAMGERREHDDYIRRGRRSRSRRRDESRDVHRRLDIRHHGRHDIKRIEKKKDRKDDKKHDDKKKRKRTRSRSHSDGDDKKHKKKDKKMKKEKMKKAKDEDEKTDKEGSKEELKLSTTVKRKPTIDEANFEPDYDESDSEGEIKKSSSSDSDTDSSSEEERRKKKHKKKKKRKKRESSSSSSSDSDSDSSDSDRKKRKKHKKNKKKKKKAKHK